VHKPFSLHIIYNMDITTKIIIKHISYKYRLVQMERKREREKYGRKITTCMERRITPLKRVSKQIIKSIHINIYICVCGGVCVGVHGYTTDHGHEYSLCI